MPVSTYCFSSFSALHSHPSHFDSFRPLGRPRPPPQPHFTIFPIPVRPAVCIQRQFFSAGASVNATPVHISTCGDFSAPGVIHSIHGVNRASRSTTAFRHLPRIVKEQQARSSRQVYRCSDTSSYSRPRKEFGNFLGVRGLIPALAFPPRLPPPSSIPQRSSRNRSRQHAHRRACPAGGLHCHVSWRISSPWHGSQLM